MEEVNFLHQANQSSLKHLLKFTVRVPKKPQIKLPPRECIYIYICEGKKYNNLFN